MLNKEIEEMDIEGEMKDKVHDLVRLRYQV